MSSQSPEVETWIIRYLTDTVTPESREKLIRWLTESRENSRHLEVVKSIWNERSSEVRPHNTDEVLERVWSEGLNSRSPKAGKSKWKFSRWFKIEAVITILFTTPGAVYFSNECMEERIYAEACLFLPMLSAELMSVDNTNIRVIRNAHTP